MRIVDQIVECRIHSIEFHEGTNSAELTLRCSEKSIHWNLRMQGISNFYAWDLRKVNIVDRLRVFEGEECRQPDIADLVSGAIHGALAGQQLVRSAEVETAIDKLVGGEAKLLVIDAVYGMELIAIAESYELVNAVV